MIDLTTILKKGDKVYSIITDKVAAVVEVNQTAGQILVGTSKHHKKYNRYGSILIDGKDCLIFPNKESRDWSSYSPFKKGEIVYAFNDGGDNMIGVFSHKENSLHYLFASKTGSEFEYKSFTNCEFFNT